MAPAQAPERRSAMIAVCLLVVFLAAKLAAVLGSAAGSALIPSAGTGAWLPVAIVWQDLAVVLAFAVVERLIRRRAVLLVVYGSLVVLAALNASVERVLSVPGTTAMLRAAGGTISDSIARYVTVANIAAIASVLAVGVLAPFIARRLLRPSRRLVLASLTASVLVVAGGPMAQARADAGPLEHNPLVALARTSLPRVSAAPHGAVRDWRASPFARAER